MSIATETAFMDGCAQAELVHRGDVAALELVEAAIERIGAVDPQLSAVLHPRFDAARAEARGGPSGPLAGVPWLLKDLGAERAGEPLHEGLVEVRDAGYVSSVTSYTVEGWLGAGAIQVGKSSTSELGMSPTSESAAYPSARNPWRTACTPGGSSGGSAAAVAAGLVPIAYANDAGGSIRIPASACGLVGLKPSRGRVAPGPAYGDVAGGLTSELAVTRSVRDTATLLDATCGWRPGTPFSLPSPARPYRSEVTEASVAQQGPLRVAVSAHHPTGALHPECRDAVERTAKLLAELGHHVDDTPCAAFDQLTLEANLHQYLALGAWIAADWRQRLGHPLDLDLLSPLVRFQVEAGMQVSAEEFLVSRQHAQQAMAAVDRWHQDVDVVVTATIPDPPGPVDGWDLQRVMRTTTTAAVANLTGQPAISLPLHWTADGLPVGVQFSAPMGHEDVLLRLAAQLEQAQPWADRRPPVHAG